MPTIDLLAQTSETDCELSKYTVKADSGDEDAYLYDLWLVTRLTSVQDADLCGKLIPGARAIYERATEPENNEKFSQTVTPAIKGLSVNISNAKKGLVAVTGAADILSVQMRGSKRIVTVTVKLRMGGQTEAIASNLTKLLRNAVTLSTDYDQQPIPFPERVSTPTPELGNVVCALAGGMNWYGRLIEGSDSGKFLLDDFGSETQVDLQDIQSFYGIGVGEGDDMGRLLASYKARCKTRDIRPSWAAITVALGQQWGQGEDSFSGQVHMVSKVTIDGAIALLDADIGSAVGEA